MKKLILTLVLSLWTIISFSQVWATAVNLTIGIRNNSESEFTWGETKTISDYIPIKIENNEITIFTEDVQYYQTLKPEYQTKDRKGSYWFAIDGDMKKCKFFMYNDGADLIMLEYDDVCIIYGVLY